METRPLAVFWHRVADYVIKSMLPAVNFSSHEVKEEFDCESNTFSKIQFIALLLGIAGDVDGGISLPVSCHHHLLYYWPLPLGLV